MYLIAAASGFLSWAWVVFLVCFGLGMVIFVHELGHFLVAKMCGVRCDKFYIGFDIGGWKIFHKKWGETEYGIGILPLGGYVKMLGQDDNPANAAEEMRRARIKKEELQSEEKTGQSGDEAPPAEGEEGEEEYILDPRSYLAKSVPQRMAIISAGVVMNVIFAFIFAVIAYWMGVSYQPSIVSGVVPGSPAWEANLQPGDEIVELGTLKKPRFRDLRGGISLGDLENGVPMKILRASDGELREITLKPRVAKGQQLATIGILGPSSLMLHENPPVVEGTPAARAKPSFEPGDAIVAVDGEEISTERDLRRILTQKPHESLRVTVRRGKGESQQQLDIQVDPRPMKRLGVIMKIGQITAVKQDSPAALAGLKEGDFIVKVDDELVGDPETLAERLRRRAVAGAQVTLTVERETEDGLQQIPLPISPVVPISYEHARTLNTPMSAPAIGIAYRILNNVHEVVPNSPAAEQDLQKNDVITSAEFLVDDKTESTPILFGDEHQNWPAFVHRVQLYPAGTKIRLTIERGEQEREVTLEPVDSDQWFNPSRGWVLEPLKRVREAESLGEAVSLGGRETKDALLMVYRFIKKLGSQVPVTALGGPGTIIAVAGHEAFEGISSLLIFLTVLSANLAVINFLPIPLLDGGHMVFLILEGILRRPVSEKVIVAFHTIGFISIISLMLFVISLDVGRFTGLMGL